MKTPRSQSVHAALFLACVWLACASPARELRAAASSDRSDVPTSMRGARLDIAVVASDEKPDGQSWDLPPELQRGSEPITVLARALVRRPPDLLLCVVDGSGNHECYSKDSRASKGVLSSLCPARYECEFFGAHVPEGPYGLLVVDIDGDGPVNDFVGGAIVAAAGDSAASRPLDDLLAQLAARLVPADQIPSEFPVIDPCTADAPCDIGSATVVATTWSETVCWDADTTIERVTGTGEPPQIAAGQPATLVASASTTCRGEVEYRWEVGGSDVWSRQPRQAFRFGQPGTHSVRVTPECRSAVRICAARGATFPVEVKP